MVTDNRVNTTRAAQAEADLSPLQILFWMLPVITALAVLAENLP